jgi:hypothetical protein
MTTPPTELREAVENLELEIAARIILRDGDERLRRPAEAILREAKTHSFTPEIERRAQAWIEAVGHTDVVAVIERWSRGH